MKNGKGVEKIDISVEKQLVVVEGSATQEQILQAIQKTGKSVNDLARTFLTLL